MSQSLFPAAREIKSYEITGKGSVVFLDGRRHIYKPYAGKTAYHHAGFLTFRKRRCKKNIFIYAA